ncbi:MAG: hypothetical protein IEMM0007_0650 [bacterium]|nr:MAG: hypothetical protein IEMM0007_0650 [bacterium]
MKSKRLRTFIEDNFIDKGLFIVSNREPYIHKKTLKGTKVDKPAGGLTSAMDAVLKATGGTWIAWGSGSGDKEAVDEKDCIAVPPENPSYTLKRVWLSKKVSENYYHGYSNQVLWPLCHIALDRVYFRRRFWEDYKKANHLFAEATLQEAEEDCVVWIHDYHLCLVPRILREEKPSLTIAHFWHIPWPDWSVFRVCPQSTQILEGLLGNDIIGFQIPLFAKNFMDCVKETLDAEINYDESTVIYRGQTTRLKSFPISIDYDRFNSTAHSKKVSGLMKKLRAKSSLPQYTGVGVDRLEYTKGLIKRLQALSLFFEKYERYRKKFTFLQITVPTRMKEPYISYQRTVEKLIEKINKKYATDDWKPIININKKLDHTELVAYYRMADIGLISSIYDGMNLVAKEYIASQADEKGVLILSEFAGAADELEGAILVNPYDIENFADSINRALKMPEKEKRDRMRLLRKQVEEHDIYKWILDIFHELTLISSMKHNQCQYLFDHGSLIKEKLARHKLFLFLDYDGTLTPIVESPEKAVLSEEIRSLIMQLKERFPVAIISGRTLQDVRERVGIEGLVYAGNHGAEIWDGKKTFISPEFSVNKDQLKDFLNRLSEALSHIQGVLIEDKGITASIHYRKVRIKYLGEFLNIFWSIANDYKDVFRITSGKKVFEIRPLNAWNKGDAVRWIWENPGRERLPVYIGDDTTDEDAFRVLKGNGISVCIGCSPEADYYLKSQKDVREFLQFLLS